MRVALALGGNAFAPPDAAPSVEGQARFARETLERLAPLLGPGSEVLLTHGNGPQVGASLLRVERAAGAAYPLPLDVCVAQTQGEMGYLLAQELARFLEVRGWARPVASLLTRVEVDPGDPAFRSPSKAIGPCLPAGEAAALRARGAAVADDAGRGLRRLVPSPDPLRVVEDEVVRRLLDLGVAVVAGGGGGVPVVRGREGLAGVEAVVDKDLTAALLADAVGAELLAIVTDVPCAFLGWRTPRQSPLRRAGASRVRALLAEGHFAPGSMGPKMLACARFASRPGRRALICDPAGLEAALRGEAGTSVVPDEGGG
jgi:carbamate kinase